MTCFQLWTKFFRLQNSFVELLVITRGEVTILIEYIFIWSRDERFGIFYYALLPKARAY